MIFNVDSIDDLVNGSTGTVIGLEYNQKKDLECIVVKFDKESSGLMHRTRYPNYARKYQKDNGTPIFRQEMEVMGRTKRGNSLGMGSKAKIYQFPLILNYASTNHKIQVKVNLQFLAFFFDFNTHFTSSSIGLYSTIKFKSCHPLE